MRNKKVLKRMLALAAAFAVLGTAWVLAKDENPRTIDIYGQNFDPIPAHVVGETGNLIFSDSPEYVSQSGVLSAGTVTGDSRVYFYHVNEMKHDQKIAIVFENRNDRDNYITIKRKLMTKPSAEYFEVGRELSRRELETESAHLETILIPAHARKQIFTELDKVKVKQDQLFSGILDFSSTKPIYVRVMMLGTETPAVGASYTAKALPLDEVRLRGTYSGVHRVMATEKAYNPQNGSASIELVNDREDPYLTGIDELTNGETVRNLGNYGVDYDLTILTEGEGPYDLYFNPLGGAYAGSIKVTTQSESKIVDLPSKRFPYIGHGTITDTLFIGTYKAGTPLKINFMPAGASNLPFRFLLTPHVDEQTIKKGAQQVEKEQERNVNLDSIYGIR